jgi:hypothetical protein
VSAEFSRKHHPECRTGQSLRLIGIRTIASLDIEIDCSSAILLNPLAHQRNPNISN